MVNEGLEESIASSKSDSGSNSNADTGSDSGEGQSMSKDEQVGYHKGSINTLIAERNELLKIVRITEQLINAHVVELKKLGVNIQQEGQSSQ